MTPKRETHTHGPRLDDALKHETSALEHGGHEARAQEGREMESAADGEPHAEVDGATGLPRDPALARRELSRHLRLTAFPASRDELLGEAVANQAPQPVLELLRSLPAGRSFGTVYEVWDALGGGLEHSEHAALDARHGDT